MVLGSKGDFMLRSRRKKKMNIVQKIWLILKPYHKQIYFITAVTALFEFIRQGGPYIFGKILDFLIQTNGLVSVSTALSVVAGLVVIRVLSLIIDFIKSMIIARSSNEINYYVSTYAFNKLMELSLDYHEKVSTGAKISMLTRGNDKLMTLVDNFTWDFQPIVLQLLFTSIFIFITNWRIGLVFTVSLIPFLLITFGVFRATRKMRAKRHEAYDISSGELGDAITNVSVVKAFAQEERENQSFSGIRELIKNLTIKEVNRLFISGLGRNLLFELFYGTLLVVGLMEINSGVLTVGSLVFLITLAERAYSNTYRLGKIYERVVDAVEPVNRLITLLNETPSVVNAENPLTPNIDGQISFKHVTFAYNKKRVLKNVSFTISSGSFTALVGKSGSGKSTIAKLLSRYYDPVKGSIVIDGQYNLKQLDLDSYRKQTAVVFQDSPVPNRKIWEVISYAAGKKSFSEVEDQVKKAAKLAYAHEFIVELDNGYLTEIGERGVKLSGGQRQRLAIARALFAEPKILIMDEPTSHLDTLSESLIQQALEDLAKEHTFTKIIIAHRLSTVQRADQILVMEKGRLVEHGNHQQLIKKNGVYAQIVKQSELKR